MEDKIDVTPVEYGVEIDADDLDPDVSDDEGETVAEGYTPYRVVETGLTAEERETSILFSEVDRREGMIEVFSNSPVSINLFLRRGYKPYKIDRDSHFFRVPLRALSIRSASTVARKRPELTKEEKAAIRERLAGNLRSRDADSSRASGANPHPLV